MRQVIINKDLMGKEQLYYTKNTYGWYYCKYFTLREEYCYIGDDSIVIDDSYIIDEMDTIPNNYWDEYNISFKNDNGKDYAIFEYLFAKYLIPYKFYINIIAKIYCDVYAIYDASILNNINDYKLIFYDENEIIGWLESCAFEVLECENIEEEVKDIP